MEKPNVGRQLIPVNLISYPLNIPEVCIQLTGRQGAFGSLQQVVNALRDLEKLRLRVDNHPLGGYAQRGHEWDQGLKYFGYAPAKGGAVDVNDSQVAQVTGHRLQIVRQLGCYEWKVVFKWNHGLR
jgi:hypothetical protein